MFYTVAGHHNSTTMNSPLKLALFFFPLEYLALLENGYCYENSTIPRHVVVPDRVCIVPVKFSPLQD